jgi:quercetin dioxygenase-like cupin family protein
MSAGFTGRYAVTADEGEPAGAMSVVKVSAAATAGLLAVLQQTLMPGIGAPPHTHTREDECSFVIEGELGYRIGDEEGKLKAGDFLRKPRLIPHAVWALGTRPARIIEMVFPGALEEFFLAAGSVFAIADPAERGNEFAKLQAQFGVQPGAPWTGEFQAPRGYRAPED